MFGLLLESELTFELELVKYIMLVLGLELVVRYLMVLVKVMVEHNLDNPDLTNYT